MCIGLCVHMFDKVTKIHVLPEDILYVLCFALSYERQVIKLAKN